MMKLPVVLVILILIACAGLAGCDKIQEFRESRGTPTPTGASQATPTPIATPTQAPASPTPAVTVPPLTSLPCRFRGSVQLDGAPVPDGTVVTVVIAGHSYTTTTPSDYGASTYAVTVTPPPGVTYSPGTAVTFLIAGRAANQVSQWELGGNVQVDLSSG